MDDLERSQRIRRARALGLTFCVAGFLAIGLGWHGMARQACTDCQLPYLVSGGLAGLALVGMGIGMFTLAHVSDERRSLESKLEGFTRSLRSPAGPGRVLAGMTAYHASGCRLVRNRDDLPALTTDEARARGLTPCRVCISSLPEDEPQTATR